jgi:hypothetical protein
MIYVKSVQVQQSIGSSVAHNKTIARFRTGPGYRTTTN